ncbi:MAG TPA: hypothetical protein VFD41_14330, partial [Actinomycetales bacterium]|nr:hypothetical protein [Actinomycetales bacterium]
MRNRRGSAGRRVAAGVVALALLGVAGLLLGLREDGGSVDGAAPPSPVPDVHYLTVDGAVLAGLPASGQAWDAVVAAAAGDLGEPDLADQHNVNAGRTFAAALVYARTGDQAYREAV